MHKRIFPALVLLLAVFSLALAGCGGAGGSSAAANPPPTQPTISSFLPSSGAVGATVTLAGTNLTGATDVSFGGHAATFQVVSATGATAVVPAGATTGKISVTTAKGTATSAANFTVTTTPAVSSFAPPSGPVGTSVAIAGSSFTGATSVAFNGTVATFTVTDDTHITASVPAGATSGTISVTAPGGTGTSAGSFTVSLPAPTITSFSPASGMAGAPVNLTGTSFTGATAVKFNGTSATFNVTDASHISTGVPAGASSGTISVTTPSGTATSATAFTVLPSAPVITGFAPPNGMVGAGVTLTGSSFTGATAVKFNGTTATFSVTDASHIAATVPAGATSGTLSVTTSAGTATSAAVFTVSAPGALDLTVQGFYVTQATQNYPAHDVPLVAGRSAWVRVFVVANQANSGTPQVRVRFINGATTNTLTISAPGGSVPLSVDTESATNSWNMAVPAAWVTPGTQVIADVDPLNTVVEANEGNNSSTQNLDVRNLKPWKVTLIPVRTADGRTGVVENANHDRNKLVDIAKRLWPLPDTIDIAVGAQMSSSASALTSTGGGWNTVLSELLAKRAADNVTDRYYFGMVNVSYNSGVAGLGYVGAPAAIGWDFNGAESILAHEEGHNFGRPHSPCGGAGNPDTQYPYAGGLIGVPGWDVFAASGNLKTSADHTDIMGYCNNQWVSDYVYKSVLNFRLGSPLGVVAAADGAPAGPAEGLLVWGRVEDGRLILEPAFRVPARGAAAEAGPYVWEGRDARGSVLARVPFEAYLVEDLPFSTARHFAFVVPLETAQIDQLASAHVLLGKNELAAVGSQAGRKTSGATLRVQNLVGKSLQVDWDLNASPVVMWKDLLTGEVRGFLRGGYAQIEDAPEQIELQLSDGVKSTVVRHSRSNP